MAKKQVGKKSTAVAPVLSSVSEANTALFAIGKSERAIAEIEKRFAAKVAALRKEADEEIAPYALEVGKNSLGLEIYADQYREELLAGGGKTVNLSAGNFGWRLTPPRVTAGRGGDAKVLERVKDLGLTQYIRTKEELDRESLLRDKPVITGVKYTQREEFFIDPKIETGGDHLVEVRVAIV